MTARRMYTADELLQQAELLTAAGQEAVREALWYHKRNGNAVAGWRDGRVVIVPPEEIVVDPPPPNGEPPSLSSGAAAESLT